MKTLKLFLFAAALFMAVAAQAQLSVNVNFGSPPMWGPVGYSEVHYYYLPDVEAYYDVPASMFIYQVGGVWVHRTYLPTRYRNYDLYSGYKVVMNDYHGNRPYSHYNDDRHHYAKGYRGPAQRSIGERPSRTGEYHGNANNHNLGYGNNGNHGNGNNGNHGNGNNGNHGNGNNGNHGKSNNGNHGNGNNGDNDNGNNGNHGNGKNK